MVSLFCYYVNRGMDGFVSLAVQIFQSNWKRLGCLQFRNASMCLHYAHPSSVFPVTDYLQCTGVREVAAIARGTFSFLLLCK
jgi:hypothetical protein